MTNTPRAARWSHCSTRSSRTAATGHRPGPAAARTQSRVRAPTSAPANRGSCLCSHRCRRRCRRVRSAAAAREVPSGDRDTAIGSPVPAPAPPLVRSFAPQYPRGAASLIRSMVTSWRGAGSNQAGPRPFLGRRPLFLLGVVEHFLAGLGELGILLGEAGDDAPAAGQRIRAEPDVIGQAGGALLVGRQLLGGRGADETDEQNGACELGHPVSPPDAGIMKIATFNINNVRRRLPNLLSWLRSARPEIGRAHVELQSPDHLVCRLLLEK